MTEKCAICKFFLSYNCRRYPPVLTPYETRDSVGDLYTDHNYQYATVAKSDWCGEFKEIEVEYQI